MDRLETRSETSTGAPYKEGESGQEEVEAMIPERDYFFPNAR